MTGLALAVAAARSALVTTCSTETLVDRRRRATDRQASAMLAADRVVPARARSSSGSRLSALLRVLLASLVNVLTALSRP